MLKKENISENDEYMEDMDYISSNKKINNNPGSLANKESVNKKSIFKKDSIKSTDNESDLSQKKLSEKIKSSFFKYNFPKNSAFKQIINPVSSFPSIFYFPFNYYFNIYQQNSFINLCDEKYDSYFHYYKESPKYLYSLEKFFKEPVHKSENSFLNKKRKVKTIIFAPTKVKCKNNIQINENNENKIIKKEKKILFQIFKRKNYYKDSKNYLKKKENNQNIYCCHLGCRNSFKTQRQAIFHHYKMSPECQEDTICFLKTISETKKIFLKIIKENASLFDKYSKLYETSMKEIILTDHINTITGKKLKDKLD